MLQPIKRTALEDKSFAESLSKAASIVLNGPLTQDLLSRLQAQVWLETTNGRNCFNNNPGNITGTFNGDYWEPGWVNLTDSSSARDRDLHELMLKGEAPSKFRSYPNLESGLIDYLSFLKKRFPTVIEAAAEGDSQQMARNIFSSHYSQLEKNMTVEAVGENIDSLANKFVGEGLYSGFPKAGTQEVNEAWGSS